MAKKKHHQIPMHILLAPGLLLLVSLLLLVFSQQNLAFFLMGVAIVVAILIHKEEY